MDIHGRSLGNSQHLVVVKVRLLNAARLHGYFLRHHGGQPIDHGALYLRGGAAHVDDRADVDGHGHLVHGEFFVGAHAHLRDFRDVCCVAEVECQPKAGPGGHVAPPAGLFCRELDDVGGAAGVQRADVALFEPAPLAQGLEEKFHVVAPCGMGHLVQEALNDKRRGVGARGAPGSAGGVDVEHGFRRVSVVDVQHRELRCRKP